SGALSPILSVMFEPPFIEISLRAKSRRDLHEVLGEQERLDNPTPRPINIIRYFVAAPRCRHASRPRTLRTSYPSRFELSAPINLKLSPAPYSRRAQSAWISGSGDVE